MARCAIGLLLRGQVTTNFEFRDDIASTVLVLQQPAVAPRAAPDHRELSVRHAAGEVAVTTASTVRDVWGLVRAVSVLESQAAYVLT